ncbi:MAG: phage head morphogenesis protein [Candidatus Brocadiaceae bacterium]|nr:phage head morphogenesis protein [Candidatus Brocadiaceae bacterium]
MTRFLVFLIVAYFVYYLIKNGLKNKTEQRTDYQKKQTDNYRETDAGNAHIREIAYVVYSATNDRNTCDVCKSLDGRHLLPNSNLLQKIKPPHAGCKNPKGCRCTLVYITKDEENGSEIETLLKRHGGICDKHVIEKERGK